MKPTPDHERKARELLGLTDEILAYSFVGTQAVAQKLHLLELAKRIAQALAEAEVEGRRKAFEEKVPRNPGCLCQWEEGDSPCPVHGEHDDG